MRIVKGLVKNGRIQLEEDVRLRENEEVVVVVGDEVTAGPELKGFTAEELEPLCGIVSLGGNALKDTEKLWDE